MAALEGSPNKAAPKLRDRIADEGGLLNPKGILRAIGQGEKATGIIDLIRGRKEKRAPPKDAPGLSKISLKDVSTREFPIERQRGTGKKRKELGYDTMKDPTERFKLGLSEMYPEFRQYWLAYGEKIVRLHSKPKTERQFSEDGPFYYQWQIIQNFVNPLTGSIDGSLIDKYFEQNLDAPDTTMLFIEQETARKAYARGLVSETKLHAQKHADLLQGMQTQVRNRDKRKAAIGAAEIAAGAVLVGYAGGVDIPANIFSAVALNPELLTTIKEKAYALYSFIQSQTITRSMTMQNGLNSAAQAYGGGALMVDGFFKFVNGLKGSARTSMVSQCEAAWNAIRGDTVQCDYMQELYGIDPRDMTTVQGLYRFQNGTSFSPGWADTNNDISNALLLRRTYMTKVLLMDDNEVFGLPEEMIRGKRHIAEQSPAVYMLDVQNEFRRLFRERHPQQKIDANVSESLKIFMEARENVLKERATKMFEKILEKKEQADMEKKKGIVERRKKDLDEGGKERQRLEAVADKRLKTAKEVVDGVKEGESVAKCKEGLETEVRILSDLSTLEAAKNPSSGTSIGLEQVFEQIGQDRAKFAEIISEVGSVLRRANATNNVDIPTSILTSKNVGYALEHLNWYLTDPAGYKSDADEISNKFNTIREDALAKLGGGTQRASPEIVNAIITNLMQEKATQLEPITTLIATVKAAITTIKEINSRQIQYEQAFATNGNRHVQTEALYTKMSGAHTEVVAANIPPTQDQLAQYPGAGSTFNDLMRMINAKVPPPWVEAGNNVFENRMKLLHAIAYAKAKDRNYVDTPTPGTIWQYLRNTLNLTSEQIMLLEPEEIHARLPREAAGAVKTGVVTFDNAPAGQLDSLRVAISSEKSNYKAMMDGLKSVLGTQKNIVAQAEDERKKVKATCETRQKYYEVASKLIKDRGSVYTKVSELITDAGFSRITDAQIANGITNLSERARYSTYELASNLPVGVIELLRAIFDYHQLGGVDTELLPEEKFDIVMQMLDYGVSLDDRIKSSILQGISNFSTVYQEQNMPAVATTSEVLSILRARHFGLSEVQNAAGQPISKDFSSPAIGPRPISSTEMKSILSGLVNFVVNTTTQGWV